MTFLDRMLVPGFNGLIEILVWPDEASGERPHSFKRGTAAFDQQDAQPAGTHGQQNDVGGHRESWKLARVVAAQEVLFIGHLTSPYSFCQSDHFYVIVLLTKTCSSETDRRSDS